MTANEVRTMKWGFAGDWEFLMGCGKNSLNDTLVTEEDINDFVENIFRGVARRLDIPYAELGPVLVDENTAFMRTKARLFKNFNSLSKNNEQLKDLERMLRVPDVYSINKLTVDKVFQDFEKLSDVEKIDFLVRIGKYSIEITAK